MRVMLGWAKRYHPSAPLRGRRSHKSPASRIDAVDGCPFNASVDSPKPFRWVESAHDILAAVQRFCQRTASVQDQCAYELQSRDANCSASGRIDLLNLPRQVFRRDKKQDHSPLNQS
jgi:hypothetical protein